jgi:hypothetical protein
VLVLLAACGPGRAQTWSWTYETIDLPARFPSLAIDTTGNLHISYADSAWALKYGFRPAGSTHWFTMVLDSKLGQFTTRLTLDHQNNPHICYTPENLKYAHWDGQQWRIQEIAKGTGQVGYTCSIAIAQDGTPHLAWYQLSAGGENYLHLRYGVLKDGSWLSRTLDFDNETGKWNSMVLDSQGNPWLAYSCWVNGELRVAHWNGKQWDFTSVDTRARNRGETYLGQGNGMVQGDAGRLHVSFFSEKSLKYAHQSGKEWKIETVDQFNWLGSWAHFRSSIVLDPHGYPHICYEDTGLVKHAYWDGSNWKIQVIAKNGNESFRYSTMAIDKNGVIYVAFRDPEDGTLKLATGRFQDKLVNPEK